MKKKLNYRRVSCVIVIIVLLIGIILYLLSQMSHVKEYTGYIETYQTTYIDNDKIYSFDLKSLSENDKQYISLNDMYNMMVILDKDAKVYMDENKDMMRCEFKHNIMDVYYGKNKIVYNNNCVESKDYDNKIYVSHKNIYISVFLTEKLVLNNEKELKFENKTAIIE